MNELGFLTAEETAPLGFIENLNPLSIPEPNPFTSSALTLLAPGMWNPRMAFDVALAIETEETIRCRYDLTEKEYYYILLQPTFRAEIAAHVSAFKENGVTFAIKARLIAEEKLEDMYCIISDERVDPRERISAWKALVEAAGLKSSSEKGLTANAQTVNIQINY